MKKIKRGWIFWTPRIIGIVFTAFLALFSLDVFGNDYGFWGTALAFLMHNIPVFILAIILWISWSKHEWLAGSVFILGGLLYIAQMIINTLRGQFEWYMISWSLQIAGPALFIGILFFIGWKRKKK
jgi:hypothetical protein